MDVYKIVGRLILEGKDLFDRDVEDTKKKGSNLASGIGKALGVVAKAGAAAVGAATTAIGGMMKASIEGFSEYEQLAGGMEKIFADMDTTKIAQDAANAYKDLGMTANEYLAIVNDVGASFASIMGAEVGYEAAKKGLTAISDYASGTGKSFNELQQKLAMITRSTSSYQSIADQFSGVLPATSEGFLKQAQAVGVLDKKYRKLTDVPIQEYQKAVTDMLAEGVEALGLTGNTAAEASETIQGSLTMTKAAWSNLLAGLADESADVDSLINNLVTSAVTTAKNIAPLVTQILNGISTMVVQIAPVLSEAIPVLVSDVLPSMLNAGVQLLQSLLDGISQNIDAVSSGAVEVAMMLVNSLVDNAPMLVTTGMQLIISLITGIAQQLPELLPVIIMGLFQAYSALIASVPSFIDAGAQLISGLGEGLMNAFASLFPEVAPWVEQNIFEPIKSVFSVAFELGGEIVSNLWEGLRGFANQLFPGLGDLITGYTGEATEQVAESFNSLPEAAESATSAAVEAVLAAPESVPVNAETPLTAMSEIMQNDTSMETAATEAVDRTASSLETAVSTAGFDSAGKTGMQKFIDGINSMESAVMSAVDRIASSAAAKMQAALEDIQNMANGATPPGLAVGLDYVPYDEFPALLHKGEAVLTAAEAAVWRAGKTAGGSEPVAESNQQTSTQSGITIVQNINAVPQTPVEFAATTEAYFEQARWSMA